LRYLVDTDVLGKKDGPNGANIRKWLASVDDHLLAISALTIFEIEKGIQRKRDADDHELVGRLQSSLEQVKVGFADRILPLDALIAQSWGKIAGADPKQWIDRCLIATAKEQGMILVTCNSKDMKGRGVEVINPERNPPGHWLPDGTPFKSAKL
jgi:predicted nucleic acid-binding protein